MAIANKIQNNVISHLKIRAGAAGLHLFNRNTGINLLVEEIKLPLSKWSSAPRQVSIALTNACDLACHHCYAPKNSAVLDFDRLKGWLIDLDVNGCIGVGFGGGEPTLYPYFAELCAYTTKNTGLAVTMTTHGHHLSAQLIEELAGNVHFIRVSMDGVRATYESIRERSFDTLIQRITALGSIAPCGINFVVNSKTINDLDTAIEIATELGCSEFLLLPEQPTQKVQGIDKDTWSTLQKWVTRYRGNILLTVSQSEADRLPTCNPLDDEIGLNAFAHIDASGVLKGTSYDTSGIKILENGVMSALYELATSNQEVNP
jgi:sulfatase maturation enzyme AslB (radical SAM superfamily)